MNRVYDSPMSESIRLIIVTCPDKETAVRLAKLSVGHRLAACAQILPGMESFYWWEGEMENANEVLLLLKSSKLQQELLEKLVKENHPYEVPEFLSLEIDHVNGKYRKWLEGELSHPLGSR